MTAVTWSTREPGWFPDTQEWVDPSGRMPVWSTMDFRRVAADLPQHQLCHLVAEMNGRPVLVAPVLRSPQPGGLLFYDVPAMIGDERAFGDHTRLGDGSPPVLSDTARTALYPSMAVGVYGAYHGIAVAATTSTPLRRELSIALLGATTDLAQQLGCASSALLYTTPELTRWQRPALGPQHVISVLGAESVLHCDMSDFAGYLATLTSRRRGRVLRERRRYLDGPARSEFTTGPGALGQDLVDLRCNLRARHGMPEQRARTEAEFASLAAWCGTRLVVTRSIMDGETVGFVINLRDGDTLYARTAGFDYERLGPRDFCYFNIVYYDTLEWALPRGVRRLELGLASYPGKRTRGCRFEPRFGIFTLPADSPARQVLAHQDKTERARLLDECGDGLDPADLDM